MSAAMRRHHVEIGYSAAPTAAAAAAAAVKDNGILPSSALSNTLDQADNAALALHLIPKARNKATKERETERWLRGRDG